MKLKQGFLYFSGIRRIFACFTARVLRFIGRVFRFFFRYPLWGEVYGYRAILPFTGIMLRPDPKTWQSSVPWDGGCPEQRRFGSMLFLFFIRMILMISSEIRIF